MVTGEDAFPDTNLNVKTNFKSTKVPELFSKAVGFGGWCIIGVKGITVKQRSRNM